MKNSRPLNDRRLSFDVCSPLLEEATFRGQILEEEGLEARFLCSSLMRPDSQRNLLELGEFSNVDSRPNILVDSFLMQ
jgi:hypothetical protein